MTPRLLRRAATIAAAVLLGTPLVPLPAGAAAPGTWGVNNAPYVNGTVCQDGGVTSPLAAWNFGDGSVDFLTTAVTSDGTQDSARLPDSSAPRIVVPVVAGQYGFATNDDIARYAALLSRFGDSASAVVAKAVLDRTSPGGAPDCVSSGEASALLDRAAAAANPYDVKLDVESKPLYPTEPNRVVVRVTSAGGAPVADVPVALSSGQAVFGGRADAIVSTGGDGVASAAFTVPAGASAQPVAFHASASATVGLNAVTAGPGYVGAIFAGARQTYAADRSFTVDLTADPAISVASSSRAGVSNSPVALSAQVGGMRGHGGQAQVRVTGPAALNPKTLCAGVQIPSVNVAFDSAVVALRGDQTINAGSWVPNAPGCYRVQAHVTTTDAVPQATANSAATVLTVLDTTSTFALGNGGVIEPGAVDGVLRVANTYGLGGAAAFTVRGPATPLAGDCSNIDWSKHPERQLARGAVDGTHPTYRLRTERLPNAGCYQVTGFLTLRLSGDTSLQVPIALSGTNNILYVLKPRVALQAARTWAVSPDAVPTRVEIRGTYGQRGTVRVLMFRAPASSFGCDKVDYSGAAQVSASDPVPFSGDTPINVNSGPTPDNGCYTLVPQLAMTANPALTANGAMGADGSTIVAGLPFTEIGTGKATDRRPPESQSSLNVWPSALAFLTLALGVSIAVLSIAVDHRRRVWRPMPGLELWD